jgi:hypothetical protein
LVQVLVLRRGSPVSSARTPTPSASASQLLRRYLARGLVVRHLRMQLFAVHVLQRTGGTLRVRVTDRVAGGVAVAAGRRLRLPGDTASTRTIVLRRVSGDWRVAAVR